MLTEYLRQYACASTAHDERIDDLIVSAHAEAVCRALAGKGGEGAVADFVRRNVAVHHRMAPFWDTAFGRAQRSLESDKVDPGDALALVAFRLAQFDAQGACAARFTRPHRLRWGQTMLPPLDAFDVHAGPGGTRIDATLEGRPACQARRNSDGLLSSDAPAGRAPQQLPAAGGITLISGDAVLDDVVLEDDFHSIFRYPTITPEHAGCFEAGLRILAKLPEYDAWVRRVVRGIVVCETVRSRTRSSSWSEAPGLVLVSLTDRPFLVAEMLVHEASHQHYNLATRLGPTVDASAQALHYSPAVDRPRPLNKVLLGYHAFANFFNFYTRYLPLAREDMHDVQARHCELEAKLAVFEQVLTRAEGLTPIGAALFWPLYERTCQARGAAHTC